MTNLSNRSGIVIKDSAYWKKRLFAGPLDKNQSPQGTNKYGKYVLGLALFIFAILMLVIAFGDGNPEEEEIRMRIEWRLEQMNENS